VDPVRRGMHAKNIATLSAIIMMHAAAAARAAFIASPRPSTLIAAHSFVGGGASRFVARSMTSAAGDDGTDGRTIVDRCREKIGSALETSDVKVTGAYDDPNGSHISVEVVSQLFEGKRPVQRQQLVYKAIWEEMQGAVHAVDSMICKTPNEAK